MHGFQFLKGDLVLRVKDHSRQKYWGELVTPHKSVERRSAIENPRGLFFYGGWTQRMSIEKCLRWFHESSSQQSTVGRELFLQWKSRLGAAVGFNSNLGSQSFSATR